MKKLHSTYLDMSGKYEKSKIFYSIPFYSHLYGYKMYIRIDANGSGVGKDTRVSVFTKLLEGSFDKHLHWPFLGTVTYELLNQFRDKNHHRMISNCNANHDMRVGGTIGCAELISHFSLGHNLATKCQATSKSFYTSSSNYHMSVNVDANGHGDGEGTHISVSAKLMRGLHDKSTSLPFLRTVTIELLNQLEVDNHHSKIITCGASQNTRVGSCVGFHQFLPRCSLGHNPATNTQYLLDDALNFRVPVKLDNHKPWLVCTHGVS